MAPNKILVNDVYNLVPELFVAHSMFEQSDQAEVDILPFVCRESFQCSDHFTIFINAEPNMHCELDFFSRQQLSRPNSIFAVSGFGVVDDWKVPYILNFSNLTMTIRVNPDIKTVESGPKKYLANALLGGWSRYRGRILSNLCKLNLDKQCLINYHARGVVPEDDRNKFSKKFPELAQSYRSPELNQLDVPLFLNMAFRSNLDVTTFNSFQPIPADTCKPIPGTKPYLHGWISQLIPYAVYNSSYISIVAETETGLDSFFISEKITKPLILAQPFVVFGGRHYLKHLRNIGFKTFHPWIDESYDNIDDENQRIDAMIESVNQFSNLSNIEKNTVMYNLKPMVEHNQKLALDNCWSTKTIADAIINFSTNSNTV